MQFHAMLKYAIILLTTFILISCNSGNERIINIGYNLIELKNVDSIGKNPNYAVYDVENVGIGLFGKLKKCQFEKSTVSFKIMKGDAEYPIGDGSATNLLKISDTNNSVTIRLKYNKELNSYQILGYY